MSFGGGGKSNAQKPVAVTGLSIQTSCYGSVVPIIFGTNRLSPNLIWRGFWTAIAHTSRTSGGKGFGGGGNTTTTYTYNVTIQQAFCEGDGNIQFGKIYLDKTNFYSASSKGYTTTPGSLPQDPWTYLVSKIPLEAYGYPRFAYLSKTIDLGSATTLPQTSCVITGFDPFVNTDATTGKVESHPYHIIKGILTDPFYGIGFSSLDPNLKPSSSDPNRFYSWYNYCICSNLFFSPIFNEQKPTAEWLNDIMKSTNCDFLWSEGYLKIKTYADVSIPASSSTWNYQFLANSTPIYDLTDDEFISGRGVDPIVITRKNKQDTQNQVSLEYLNSEKDFNPTICEVKDDSDIQVFGLRKSETINCHWITNKDTAQSVAQTMLQRGLYVRNTYSFTLSLKFSLLEPFDLITLTDAGLGLYKRPVRILSIEETDDMLLNIEAEDFLFGNATPTKYVVNSGDGNTTNQGTYPGQILTPSFFSPPYFLNDSVSQELWIAVSSLNEAWGGCDIYASLDNIDYQQIGTIYTKARYGKSLNAFGNNNNAVSDTTSQITAQLTSGGSLLNASASAMNKYVTLFRVGSELMSYQYAQMNADGNFELWLGSSNKQINLIRGVYGTPISSHSANESFVRMDDAIYRWNLPPSFIPTYPATLQIYFKFLSFNQWGLVSQSFDGFKITNITKSTSAVVTSPNHTLTNGNRVVFSAIAGMTQINNLAGNVTVIDANNFSVDINSTSFSTYTPPVSPATYNGIASDVIAYQYTISQIQLPQPYDVTLTITDI